MDSIKVIHISIDGLTPHVIEEMGNNKLPNLHYLQKHGVYTHNARTDVYRTITLPNHVCMFTSRGSNNSVVNNIVRKGHNINFNSFDTFTKLYYDDIHDTNKEYINSVFDVLKKHGYRSGMFVGKSKFEFLDKSYDETTGVLFEPDGIDEIDVFIMGVEYKINNNDTKNIINNNN